MILALKNLKAQISGVTELYYSNQISFAILGLQLRFQAFMFSFNTATVHIILPQANENIISRK